MQQSIAIMNMNLQDIQQDIHRLATQQSQMQAQHLQAQQLMQAQQIANMLNQVSDRNSHRSLLTLLTWYTTQILFVFVLLEFCLLLFLIFDWLTGFTSALTASAATNLWLTAASRWPSLPAAAHATKFWFIATSSAGIQCACQRLQLPSS